MKYSARKLIKWGISSSPVFFLINLIVNYLWENHSF